MQDQNLNDLLAQSAIMRLIHTYPRGLDHGNLGTRLLFGALGW